MSATLNLYSLTLAYGDPTANNNPALRFVDWKRVLQGVPVENPKSEALVIQPGVEKLVFDGVRSLAVDGTTAFDLAFAKGEASDRYRLVHAAGTPPAFRTDRGLDLTDIALTLAVQPNGSLLVQAAAGTPFAALQAGDEVFIPGPSTGDAATVFQPFNEGSWTVLATASGGAKVYLARPDGAALMLAQEATPASAAQVQGFSSTGVQVGDKLDLSAGFAPSARKTFVVAAVTAKRLEFACTTPLADEAGVVPGAAGIQVFSGAKRFIRIEADQDCVIRLNGDTGSSVRLSPWTPGDPEQVAEFTTVGPVWSLKVLNRAGQALHVNVISAE